jgi:predicted ATP-dependent endonuclease of OLD family
VTLLQELAAGGSADAPTLLLGFEEPELYQHPPQARHLAATLQNLTEGNAQVVVATHSPFFASGRHFESVRVLRKPSDPVGATLCTQISVQDIANALAEALGKTPEQPSALLAAIEQIVQPSQRELLFCGLPVLVEGTEDVALIAAQLRLSGRWDDFRRVGGHFVLAMGKTNLSRLLAICNSLMLPAYVVFDGDGPHKADTDKACKNKERNERDNRCILHLAGLTSANPLSDSIIRGDSVTMWPETLLAAVKADTGEAAWSEATKAVRDDLGLHDTSNKNGLLLAAILEAALQKGASSTALSKLCDDILSRAARPIGMSPAA